MFRSKVVKKPRLLVWRMSAANPGGEFVAPCEASSHQSTDPAELHERGLRASSLELSNGSDVVEMDMDTLPGELIDAFIKAGW